MSTLLLPHDEENRLAALERYALLDTPPEAAFDRLASLAARLFQMPLALVTLSDRDRQWLKSCQGTARAAVTIREIPRAAAFCMHTILSDKPLVVEDARQDARFARSPLVTEMGVRFYAGVPLINAEGCALGTFCVMDFQPRSFSEDQRTALRDLAAGVVSEMELRRTAAALGDSERLYRQMFEDSPHPMWVFDVETLRFLAVNETAVARYGYSRAEFLAMTLADLRPPEDLPLLQNVRAGHGLQPADKCVVRHRKKDGRLIWAEVAVHSLDFNDRVARMVIAHDVTERKQAEAALSESERRFREIAETIQEVFWVGSADRTSIEYISPAYERLWGLSCADLYAHPDSYLQAIHPDDRAGVLAKRQAGPDYDNEYRIVRPNGEIRWVRTRSFPVYDANGAVQRLVGLSEDVTERRESQEQYRLLAESVDDMVSLHEMKGRCLYASPSVLKMTGYTVEEIVGRNTFDFLHPADHRRLDEVVDCLAEEGQPARVEVRWLRKDGRSVWVEARINLVQEAGQPKRLVAVSRDISARREMEDALRGAQERLQTIITNLPVILYAINADRVFTFTDGSGLAAVGRRPGESVGKRVADVYGDNPEFLEAMERAFEGTPVVAIVEVRGVIFDIRYSPVFDPDGRVGSIIGLATDVTESKRAEQALRRSEERLNLALRAGGMGLWDCDFRTGQITGSGDYARLLGRTSPAPGYTFVDFLGCVHAEDRGWMTRLGEDALAGRASFEGEYRVVWPDGTIRWLAFKGMITRDERGQPVRGSGATMDITERKALEFDREALLAQAEALLADALAREDRDTLTGLINHRAFHKQMEEELEAARQQRRPLALLLMDVDNFKFFNDAYGHLAGDDLLRQVAQALLSDCGPQEALARFGGDEFALLMPGATAAQAARRADSLREAVSLVGCRPPGYDISIPLSLSFGSASLLEDGCGRMALLEAADARLRVAKSGGDEDGQAVRLRRTMARSVEGFSMLDALVTAVDNKDRYTRKHSEDVMAYSVQIGRELGLDEKTQHVIEVAALLHDVGKIGVPDQILRKPGALSREDFQAIQQHPLMGAIIVGAVPGFEDTLDAVRHHHERWDGGGYPFGLRGEETPLLARLMAVADAYSAMTTDRPYRKGMEPCHARRILEEGAGTQWDPACVAAFLRANATMAAGG